MGPHRQARGVPSTVGLIGALGVGIGWFVASHLRGQDTWFIGTLFGMLTVVALGVLWRAVYCRTLLHALAAGGVVLLLGTMLVEEFSGMSLGRTASAGLWLFVVTAGGAEVRYDARQRPHAKPEPDNQE
jgi:hypothetical protein